MPVRINLLSEAIAAEEDRRNDPVKRTAWIGAFCIFLVVLWYSTLLFEQMVVGSRLEEKKTEWSRLDPENKDLKAISVGIRDGMDRVHSLDRLATNRFLWAPVLNALQYSMVNDQVQLTRLYSAQTFDVVKPPKEDESKKKKDSTPAPKKKKTKAPLAKSTERIVLTLDARDFGTQSQQNYQAFMEAVGRADYFKDNLQSGGIKLANLATFAAPVGADGVTADKAYTDFKVECRFTEKERN